MPKNASKNMKPSLGVVAICRNEEEDLPNFIKNLESWVDEIIVIDDDSTDNSKNILKKVGQKIKFIERSMDSETGFAGQRNHGIDAAKSDWLLHMDIDERVPPALASEILTVIKSDEYNAYRYRRLNFFLHRPMKGGGFQDWNKPQLARRGMHHFENAVHETCVIESGPDSIGQLKEKMWHLNDESYNERMEKSMVYCRNQGKRLLARKITIKWYHLLAIPLIEFLRKFLWKQGYRDGMPGLLLALHSSCAMFRACALVWDMQNKLGRSDIEKQIYNI